MDDKKYQAMLANVGRHCYVFPYIETSDDPDIIGDDDYVGYAAFFFPEGPKKGVIKKVEHWVNGENIYEVDTLNDRGVVTDTFSVPPSFVAFNYGQYAHQCQEMRYMIDSVLKTVKNLKCRFSGKIEDDGWLTKENEDD